MLPTWEEPGVEAITLWLVTTGTVLGLVTVAMGLFSTLTGKDPLPRLVRSRMRRSPASAEDFRLRGTGLILYGAALTLIASYMVITVVQRLASFSSGPAYVWLVAEEPTVDFPKLTITLVSTVAAAVAVALFVAGRAISARVHYQSIEPAPGSQPGVPPA